MGSVVVGRGNLEANLKAMGDRVESEMVFLAEQVLATARSNIRSRSGRLVASGYVSQVWVRSEGWWRIEIVFTAPYAAAQERGSGLYAEAGYGASKGAYQIVPRDQTLLKFRWPDAPPHLLRPGSDFVFLPGVMNPGVRPTRFLRDALKMHTERTWTRIYDAAARGGGL